MKPVQKLSQELPFIKELEALKAKLDSKRPLSPDLEKRVLQKLRLDWNYNTNAIEGNSFTRGETITLLMEGITAKGKPLKDALDIKGHNRAIDFMMQMLKEERPISESDIRGLHKIVLGEDYENPAITNEGLTTSKRVHPGKYKTAPNHVKTATGEIHYYASVEDTPAKMQELVQWYKEAVELPEVNPVVLASLFHHKFVAIHPFDDGNGRMTRLLTNFILLKFGYPVSVIKKDKRLEYYGALSQADNGEVIPIIEMVAETVRESLEIYLKATDGKNISEIDDLDKEIELFVKGFDKENILKETKQQKLLIHVYDKIVIPFLNEFLRYSNKIDNLFYSVEKSIVRGNEKIVLDNKVYLTHDTGVNFSRNNFYIANNEDYDYVSRMNDNVSDIKDGFKISEVNSLGFHIFWKGFLKNKTQDNYDFRLSIQFGEYQYYFKSNGNLIYSNYYTEVPNDDEINNTISAIFKEIIIKTISGFS